MSRLDLRLDQLITEISSHYFLYDTRCSNHCVHYIFDYAPQEERIFRQMLLTKLDKSCKKGFNILHLDFFELALRRLKAQNLYHRVFELEQKAGSAITWSSLKTVLSSDLVIQEVIKDFNLVNPHVLFLSGIGRIWPILKIGTILNCLKTQTRTPVVIFFPGSYNNCDFWLFNEIQQKNHFYTLQLIPFKEK